MGAIWHKPAAGKPSEALWPLPAGQETLEELRELILQLALIGPAQHSQPTCPFRILSNLTYASLTHLVAGMSRETCLHLFDGEEPCICQTHLSAGPPAEAAHRPPRNPGPPNFLT